MCRHSRHNHGIGRRSESHSPRCALCRCQEGAAGRRFLAGTNWRVQRACPRGNLYYFPRSANVCRHGICGMRVCLSQAGWRNRPDRHQRGNAQRSNRVSSQTGPIRQWRITLRSSALRTVADATFAVTTSHSASRIPPRSIRVPLITVQRKAARSQGRCLRMLLYVGIHVIPGLRA